MKTDSVQVRVSGVQADSFQAGWKIVDRLVHGGGADLIEPAFELAS
jgi:hypothetical protein